MDCTVKLQRADKLIGGLGGERVRWQATVDQLGQDLINVVGDVVVAAGCIAYSGAQCAAPHPTHTPTNPPTRHPPTSAWGGGEEGGGSGCEHAGLKTLQQR